MAGSLASAWVNGITYFPKADTFPTYEADRDIEGIRHSGGTLKKVTLKEPKVTGFEMVCPNSADVENLRTAMKKQGNYGVGWKEQDGTIWNATGYISEFSYMPETKSVAFSMTSATKDWEVTFP